MSVTASIGSILRDRHGHGTGIEHSVRMNPSILRMGQGCTAAKVVRATGLGHLSQG